MKLTEESSNSKIFNTSRAQQLSASKPDLRAIIIRQASIGATSARVSFRRLYRSGVIASTLSGGNVISLFDVGCWLIMGFIPS